MYLSTHNDRYSVPPLSRYQQEIGDVNQGEVRRGLQLNSGMYLMHKQLRNLLQYP
ncbi:hypothetical protein VCHA50O413_40112 [Vibrio chagasii]|nr:hypothetical protein VCHA35O135_20262 [Vibrio chagasii]CAH6946390.1 hypothetical protein VCHA34P120_30131 [Vibrio chagasii]CAH7063920.1 hypothetical protein VCHA49P379_10082 [Vibrio chagasii]CAH7203271.1 hypothetical protein VCHA50O405_30431 [Vibrio chagasii]CAH7218071.1 hypothetical protein VCHA43P273_310029 [Vibrio chagasii]